jgi:hypothetical protein
VVLGRNKVMVLYLFEITLYLQERRTEFLIILHHCCEPSLAPPSSIMLCEILLSLLELMM